MKRSKKRKKFISPSMSKKALIKMFNTKRSINKMPKIIKLVDMLFMKEKDLRMMKMGVEMIKIPRKRNNITRIRNKTATKEMKSIVMISNIMERSHKEVDMIPTMIRRVVDLTTKIRMTITIARKKVDKICK